MRRGGTDQLELLLLRVERDIQHLPILFQLGLASLQIQDLEILARGIRAEALDLRAVAFSRGGRGG